MKKLKSIAIDHNDQFILYAEDGASEPVAYCITFGA